MSYQYAEGHSAKLATRITAVAFAVALSAMTAPTLAHDGGGGGGHGGGGHGGGWGGHGGGWGGHGFHHGFHGGFFGGFGGYGFYDPFWGAPFYGYPYGYPAYAYPAYSYPDLWSYPNGYPSASMPLSAAPPQAVPAGPPPQSFWYFCQSSNAYYPYVSSCPEPWRQVPTTPQH